MTGAMRSEGTRAWAMLTLLLLACALLLRLAVPAGWMPMADSSGAVRLVPCSGMGPMEPAGAMDHAMPGMAMAHHHAGKVPSPAPDHADGEHGCPFSSLSMALSEPASPAIPLPFAAVAQAGRLPLVLAAIGRGLAAPPPPSTGPPSLT